MIIINSMFNNATVFWLILKCKNMKLAGITTEMIWSRKLLLFIDKWISSWAISDCCLRSPFLTLSRQEIWLSTKTLTACSERYFNFTKKGKKCSKMFKNVKLQNFWIGEPANLIDLRNKIIYKMRHKVHSSDLRAPLMPISNYLNVFDINYDLKIRGVWQFILINKRFILTIYEILQQFFQNVNIILSKKN